MPKFSLVYLTYRPGGLDLLAQSLIRQDPCEYELLVVDDYPSRPERGVAVQYLQAHGLPLVYYGPPYPKSFPDTPLNLANAMNTGALNASADWVVFLHDFTAVPDDGLHRWEGAFAKHGNRTLISGVAEVYDAPPPDREDFDLSVWNDLTPLQNRFIGKPTQWIPEEFENFYCGVPMSFLEAVNGIDERADDHISWPMLCMVLQAKLHNYRLVVDRGLTINMIDHRVWAKNRSAVWHAENIATGIPSGLTGVSIAPDWGRRSQNPYEFGVSRRDLLAKRGAP